MPEVNEDEDFTAARSSPPTVGGAAEVDRDRIDSGWVATLHQKVGGWARSRDWWPPGQLGGRARSAFGAGPGADAGTAAFPLARLRRDKAFWALGLAVVAWGGVFGYLTWLRHARFSSFGFDLGIFDQATWLLSRFGGQFITVRGLDVLAHHANFGLYLFAPFYWVGAGPHFLNLVQVAACALGAVPVFLLARHRLRSSWAALLLAGAFLLHPSLQFMMWEQFHPETIAITPLLFAYWFAVRERWGWLAAMAMLAVSFKEDVALAVIVIGVIIALRGNRKIGLLTAGLALGWFLFVTMVLLPYYSGSEAFYVGYFFSNLGDTPLEVVTNAVFHPSRLVEPLTSPGARQYMFKMTAPFGFLPLAAPLTLLMGVPQAAINLLSVNSFTREITYHYAAIPLAGLILATVEGISLLGRHRVVRLGLVAIVTVASVLATLNWGLSPVGDQYRKGWWPFGDDARRASKEHALALVPSGAAVSATYQFVPHLSRRELIYQWPNPFKPAYWGVANENFPPASAAQWLVLDRQLVGPEERELLAGLLAREFTTLFEADDIVVARRPGTGPAG